MAEIIRFENVNFLRNKVSILEHVNFSLKEGESLAILGRNGAGKTTLVNLLFGYLWPSSGRIRVLGEEFGNSPLKPIQSQMGILQSSHQEMLLQRSLTALEVVVTGLHMTLGLYHEIKEDEVLFAKSKLTSFKMLDKANLRYSDLSSGEKTKILLLRAVGMNKKILVLDEPTAALDLTARYEFENSITQLKAQNPELTRILITHRIEEIPPDFEKVMLLKTGTLLGFGKKSEILTEPNLSSLYDLPLNVHLANGRYSTSFR